MDVAIPYTRFTLDNGLDVLVHEDHAIPVVSVNLWYRAGSANEVLGRTGFAHLFEHLMFEGSKHVPSGEFDRLLESVGGTNNGSTSTDRNNYWANVPSNALDLVLYPWLGGYVKRIGFRKPESKLGALVSPTIAEWCDRIEALPYFDKTIPAHWREGWGKAPK